MPFASLPGAGSLVFATAERLALSIPGLERGRASGFRDGDSEPLVSLYSFQIPYSSTTTSHSFMSPAAFGARLATVRPPQAPLASAMLALAAAAVPPPQLKHVPVRGDGRCLFRAIAKNLAKMDGRALPERLEREDADYLRDVAWKAICKRRRAEFERRHIVEGSMASYCAASRHPSFYGGEPEMLALADELKLPIAVFLRVDGGRLRNIVTYGEEYADRARKRNPKVQHPAVRLLYVNGNHYDALLPKG